MDLAEPLKMLVWKTHRDFGTIGAIRSAGEQRRKPTRSPIVRINSAGALKIPIK